MENRWTRPNHFDFVLPNLAVGGQCFNAADARKVADAGITHVLDLRIERSDRNLFRKVAPDVVYIWLGTDDDGWPKEDSWYAHIERIAAEILATPDHKILVHCAMGVNRGPTGAYVILRSLYGYDAETARRMLEDVRPCVWIAYSRDYDLYRAGVPYSDRLNAVKVREAERNRWFAEMKGEPNIDGGTYAPVISSGLGEDFDDLSDEEQDRLLRSLLQL